MKIVTLILAVMLLLNGLLAMGLLGFALATGRMDQQSLKQYLATWKGQQLVPPPEVVEEEEQTEDPKQAGARLAEAQMQEEMLNREIQRRMELLRNMNETVTIAQQKVRKQYQELLAEKDAFQQRLQDINQQARDEGFQLVLKRYAAMKSKYVKNDLMLLTDREAARLLAAMKVGTATDILNEFRTDEEQAKRIRVLTLMQEMNTIDPDNAPPSDPAQQANMGF